MDNEPPDKYKTIKCKLDKIVKDDNIKNIIKHAMDRTNTIITHTYQFIRLLLLGLYKRNINFYKINEEYIRTVFKVFLIKAKGGPTVKNENIEFLKYFYDEYYSELLKPIYKNNVMIDKKNDIYKIDGSRISRILTNVSTDMAKNIVNNIKLNFLNYIRRYVNAFFKNDFKLKIEQCEDKIKKKELKKLLDKNLKSIKNDLIKDTLTSDVEFHNWIKNEKIKIYPSKHKNLDGLSYDPLCYLKSMIYMCLKLEEHGKKSFQFFPLRTSYTFKNVTFDSGSLMDLVFEKDKNIYFKNVELYKNKIWNKCFNLKRSVFKLKNYSFDHTMCTDGYTVSLRFINNKYIPQNKNKKSIIKKAIQLNRKKCKNMNPEQLKQYKKEKEILKNKKKKDDYEKKKLNKQKFKEELNKMTEDEKKIFLENEKINKLKKEEFPYIDDLTDTQLTELKNNVVVCVDPGKRVLCYMRDLKGNILRHTNRKHLMRTKRLKYRKKINKFKKKDKEFMDMELKLSKFNSKTCDYNKFKKYIKCKNDLMPTLLNKYDNIIFKKHKWYSYINTKRAEDKLIQDVKNRFKDGDKKIILCYGDWSIGKQMRHFISTPNISIKRKLKSAFKIYDIDEYNTSKLNYKTEEVTENMDLKVDNKKTNKKMTVTMHSILTYQMKNKRLGCINRDYNSVMNMEKIVLQCIKDKTRPEKYRRSDK